MENLTIAQLTEVYNTLTVNTIKKFSSKEEGQRRLKAIMAENSVEFREKGPADEVIQDFGFAVLYPTPVKKSRAAFGESDEIEINTSPVYNVYQDDGKPAKGAVIIEWKNPKRKNSKSFKRFALYTPGMTVGEYLDAAHALQPELPRYKFLADIHWDLNHGYISVFDEETMNQ